MYPSRTPFSGTPIAVPDRPGEDRAVLRRLGSAETGLFAGHLLRLGEGSRRLRFGTSVRDDFIRAYAAGEASRAVRIGLFAAGTLRGVAELHIDARDPAHAEAAFSLEAAFRRRGFGTKLFAALLREAHAKGVARLTLQCLRENVAMQRIARRFSGELAFEGSELTATLRVQGRDPGPERPETGPFDWLAAALRPVSSPLPA